MSSNTVSQDRVVVLQQSINEVLLHTGKALKAAQSNEPQDLEAIRGRLSTRMAETVERYDRAVDDIEREVLDAKATLSRDLRAVRARIEASKQAGQQAAASPTETKAPLTSQPAPPTQTPVPVPVQGAAAAGAAAKGAQQQQQQSQTPPIQRNGVQQQSPTSQPVAPIPDMGVGMSQPAQPSQPQPQPKASSPLLSKKAPAASTPTPPPKPSPRAAGAGNLGAQPSPVTKGAMPVPVPTPQPTPTAALTTPVTSIPATSAPASAPAPAAPMSAAPVPMMDASQGNDLLNLPSTTPGPGGLNFTDMEFTVAQGNNTVNQGPSQPMSMEMPGSNPEAIDLDSLFDTEAASGGQRSAAPTASMNPDGTPQVTEQPQQTGTQNNDIFDLGGGTAESMDLDFALDQSGGTGDSYLDELFFSTGDGSLGELDESSLG